MMTNSDMRWIVDEAAIEQWHYIGTYARVDQAAVATHEQARQRDALLRALYHTVGHGNIARQIVRDQFKTFRRVR